MAEHPESILYQYLTNPRDASPRWFQEGSAVFMETWDGRRSRSRAGRLRRDGVSRDGARRRQFYDPLGLVSKGTEVDFQVGANAYLYGTRFMSYLALQYTPGKTGRLVAAGRRHARYYADDFERVFGKPLDQAWQDWIAWEHEFQRQNLALVHEHPITPYKDIARRGLGAISRAYFSTDGKTLYAGVRYPGRVPHLVSISLADGTVKELARDQGRALYRVASLAYDPATQTLFYTTDNLTTATCWPTTSSRASRACWLEGRASATSPSIRADRSLWGLRTNNGFVVLVRVPYPYNEWKSVHVFPYGEVP